jgi:ABC-2 type transport system permease protein
MSTVAVLVAKDLRRRLADPLGLVLNLAIPIVLAGTIVLGAGAGGGKGQVPQLRLVLVDLDDSPLSHILAGASQNPEVARRLSIVRASGREEGMRGLREEDASALLVLPAGFSDAVLEGRTAELELIKNPSHSVMPLVAQQGAEIMAFYVSTALRLLGDDRARVKALFEGEGWDDAEGIARIVTTARSRVKAADELLLPPIIEVKKVARTSEGGGGFDWIAWMYPGMVVMGLLFAGLHQMRDLLREREAGTLRRLLASPVAPGQVLLAKALSVAVVVAAALAILLGTGSAAFGIGWGPPALLAAASALLVLAVTGFSALVFSLVRTERQGDAFGGILVMVMSLLGGSFVPPQVLPDALRRASAFTVSHWGHEALRALSYGGGWDRIAPNLAVLAAMGIAFTALGTAILRRRHLRGSL